MNKKWKGTYRLTCPVECPQTDKELKTLKSFKTAITVFEKSNSGYLWQWDERTLVGKLFGGVFGRKEYDFDGKQGFYTCCRFMRSVEAIKNGVDVPKDLLLERKDVPSTGDLDFDDDFHMMVNDDDLPF